YDVPNVALETGVSNLRNAVNYYPDFDQGGADLAYALYVLARQGDVAIGDLRYFADEKVASFTNPVAHAHLGAALAQFGDRGRSDAMFAAAARGINLRRDAPEGAIWRRDYGSYRRDDAAILALAIEAGTDSISRNDLARYLARPYDRVSTQEAAWTLRAAHALIDDQSRDRISVNGVVHEGPLVHLRSVGQATLAMKIENTGTTSTEVTVTSLGVPNVPALAGGNGYAIKRAYYNMDGTPMNSAVISAGTRLVTVLTVTPFGRQEARLMVNDPLPAGFEIDNPNLIRGGDIAALNWLKLVQTERAQFLTDRFLAAVDWRSDKPFQLAYIVRAVSPGAFHHPAASVEDMYRPQMRANSNPGRVTILQ
ncbi:MAG: alpha-2-macroglobulin family protein, partial [Planktomarina sp.]